MIARASVTMYRYKDPVHTAPKIGLQRPARSLVGGGGGFAGKGEVDQPSSSTR